MADGIPSFLIKTATDSYGRRFLGASIEGALWSNSASLGEYGKYTDHLVRFVASAPIHIMLGTAYSDGTASSFWTDDYVILPGTIVRMELFTPFTTKTDSHVLDIGETFVTVAHKLYGSSNQVPCVNIINQSVLVDNGTTVRTTSDGTELQVVRIVDVPRFLAAMGHLVAID